MAASSSKKKAGTKVTKVKKGAVSYYGAGDTPPSNSKPNDRPAGVHFATASFAVLLCFACGVLSPPLLHLRDELLSSQSVSAASGSSSDRHSLSLPQHVPCTKANLDSFLHSAPVKGLHVVCVESLQVDDDGNEVPLAAERRLETRSSIRLTFYKGAHAARLKRRVNVKSNSWEDVKVKLVTGLSLLPETPILQPWALFSAMGDRIVGERDKLNNEMNDRTMSSLVSSELLVIAEGGNWIWPGVSEGFRREIELAPSTITGNSKNVTIETLSMKPLVLSISGFLADEECDYIMEKAAPTMKYSGVSLKDADKGRPASDWRTSQSTFVAAMGDPILRDIELRTASLTRVPVTHQEFVQVLRYGVTEKYDAHHDFFDPSSYRSDPGTLQLIENGKKNRYATVFWYLTDVARGGETCFPRHGGAPPPRDFSMCTGLKVKPQKGKVIIFYSLDASGEMDPLSLHGACPVLGKEDIKWAANKWLWNAPMSYVPP